MSCIYYYKGHQFESELDLDSFLLEKEKYADKYPDIVFSSKTAQLSAHDILQEINKKAREDDKLYELWRESIKDGSYDVGEDGELQINKRPYIGVNRFLASIEGERLFPEFREKEYWDNRFDAWENGNFNDKELEIFGFDKNNPPKITDFVEKKKLKLKIKFKWESLAKTGTAIHEIMLLYFTKDGDKYIYEMDDPYSYIKSKLSPENLDFINRSTTDVIKDGIQHAELLLSEFKSKFGENLIFYPEFMVSEDAIHPDSGATLKLIGIIDLVVLDSEGRVHIVDYKTSIKDYGAFDTVKSLTYNYQLATYQRILERKGLNVYESKMYISPIKIKNMRLSGDVYIYDGIESPEPLKDITNNITETIWDNVTKFAPPKFKFTVTTELMHKSVSEIMKEWFPSFNSDKLISRETVIKMLKKRNLLKANEKGEFRYKAYDTKDAPIVSTSESDFIDLVLTYEQNKIPFRLTTMGKIKMSIKEGIKNDSDDVEWVKNGIGKHGESVSWVLDNLRKYCNSNWEVLDNDAIESYGIIMLKNKFTNQVDFVRISTSHLLSNYRQYLDKDNPARSRLSLTGEHEADLVEQSKSDSLMLESSAGNIELMEMMAVINTINGLENCVVGEVKVMNPYHCDSVVASNEELLYCFNALNNHKAMAIDNFKDGTIKFANRCTLLTNKFRDIMAIAEANEFKEEYRVFKLFLSSRDIISKVAKNDVDVSDKIEQLLTLLLYLNKDNKTAAMLSKTYSNSKDLNNDVISLYNSIITTIALLKGINFRQQLSDHSKWLESAMIFKHGLTGTYLDNPGNLNSQTLNLVTKLTTEAYQNTRDEMQVRKNKILEKINKFKQAKSKSNLALNLYENLADFYKNLIEEVDTGRGIDLMFKDINNVSDPNEKELLEFVLKEINRNRFPNDSDSVVQYKINNYDTDYYRVPLCVGGSDSVVSSKGLMKLFREKIRCFNPKYAFQKAREKIEGLSNAEEDTKSQLSSEVIYKMTNMFDSGEESTERRLRLINAKGVHYFERNLETLLLKHDFAYIQLKNVDKVFPLIKAATIHLSVQGAAQNTKFTKDLEYMNDYIRNKIKNESIVNPEFQNAVLVANVIKKAASILTLAFSPVLALYQPLQGLWQDISLMIRKPDGTNAFTFNHFKNAIKIVGKDLFHFSDTPTLCSSLNELYAINDMDMNTYATRIAKSKKGIWNFENLMFKFASRPDYYNRFAIFLSQMQGDGCLDAHYMENGVLKYDWKKDKRFEAFANGRTSDPKYNEQKSLWYTIALLFVREHTLNPDGTEFKIDLNNPSLPRAYTTQQSESYKSLSDDIYGYYSHEKKTMITAGGLGALWMLFKTFWSGKKNQYLLSGGVRMKGKYEQKVEKDANGNEIKYYYQVDSSGNIKFDEPLTTTPTIAPFMVWKGQWQEGILLTLSDIASQTLKDPKHFIQHFNDKWNNPDETMRNCYRSNMKQITYDLIMFFVIGSIIGGLLGDWLKELKEENRANTDLITGLKVAGANVLVSAVKNSALDLNFIDSIGSPIASWTPFAFEWSGRLLKNITEVATGKEDLWDGVLNLATVTKLIRPIFDSIKPEMFRTVKEGGTWERSSSKK